MAARRSKLGMVFNLQNGMERKELPSAFRKNVNSTKTAAPGSGSETAVAEAEALAVSDSESEPGCGLVLGNSRAKLGLAAQQKLSSCPEADPVALKAPQEAAGAQPLFSSDCMERRLSAAAAAAV